jgi:peptidoglycan hydrolase-like protein with peptidoglycan-binding domain
MLTAGATAVNSTVTTSATTPAPRVLREGAQGADVQDLNKRLRALRYDADAGDRFTPRTTAAVRSFQKANALVVDGIVGPKTHAALASSSAKPSPTSAPAPSQPAEGARLLKVGVRGKDVLALKDALRAQKYLVDSGDLYTASTRDAVMAFQKVNGLQRDGVAGPQTQAAIKRPKAPKLVGGASNRVEVDKSTQTMTVVRGGRLAYISNASTGNPRHPDGRGMETPNGTFRVDRKIDGWRHAPLGALYKPSYFNQGIAVHGASSVPAERASHGCVRVPMWAADKIYSDMPIGTQVIVHGR